MRIALYNPISFSGGSYTKRVPPISLLGMAQKARVQGARVSVFDQSILNQRDLMHGISSFMPNVVGLGIFYDKKCLENTKIVADSFRARATLVAGGHLASTNPEYVAKTFRPAFIVLDEGEEAFASLIRADFDPSKLDDTEVSMRQIGETYVIKSKRRYNLDEMPLPTEFDFIHFATRFSEGTINAARGCIGHCTFCGGAKKALSYMSPERVLEQIRSWKELRVSMIDLLAPDFTSNPKKASEIIRAINRSLGFSGLEYFFSVRQDSMMRALEIAFEDGSLALEEWERFFASNKVLVEAGTETLVARRLKRDQLRKAEERDEHYRSLVRMLQMNAKVAVDLITFDPDVSLQEVAEDYETLYSLAKKFPNMVIYPEAIFRELILFPGTEASNIYGNGTLKLRPYKDLRAKSVLEALKTHRDFFGISKHLPLSYTLERILALLHFVMKNYKDPSIPVPESKIDSFVDLLHESPSLVSSFAYSRV